MQPNPSNPELSRRETGRSGIDRREECLAAIPGYQGTPVMLYRCSVLDHRERVSSLEEELRQKITESFPNLKVPLLGALIQVHDDLDMITWSMGRTEKRTENGEERRRNSTALGTLKVRHKGLNLGEFSYTDLLNLLQVTALPEPALVAYLHEFDYWGAAMHEVFAGNTSFIPVAEAYTARLHDSAERYPVLRRMVEIEHPMLHPSKPDFWDIAGKGTRHTRESIREGKGCAPYDAWVKAITREGKERAIHSLTFQREKSHPTRISYP